MNTSIVYPILISSLAAIALDEENYLASWIVERFARTKDRTSLGARLRDLGKEGEIHYENFRIAQLFYIASEMFLLLSLFLLEIISASGFLLLSLFAAISTILITEIKLSARVKKRKLAIDSEYSALIEMITLAVGAGVSVSAAIQRISIRGDGYLATEMKNVSIQVQNGLPLSLALDSMSKRLDSLLIRRFTDLVIISITRGTPLVESLRHSAYEARSLERVNLLASAGKSEISMMIPVVFLILPISILFALYPSFATLNLFT